MMSPVVKHPVDVKHGSPGPRRKRIHVTEEDTGLKVLYDPKGETQVDIVAVHGIGAHPDKTWSRNSNSNPDDPDKNHYVNWLQDEKMLPAAVKKARIMRFGYQSAWFGDEIRTDVVAVADKLLALLRDNRKDPSCQTRPLLFIAHCFGGLVVLRALQAAGEIGSHPSYRSIHDAIVGIAFFGTPFRGTEQGGLAALVQAVRSEYGDAVHDQVLRAVHPDDATVRLVVKYIQQRRNKWRWPQIACFYEEKRSDLNKIHEHGGLKTYRVDSHSGCLDAAEHKQGLQRTHFDMNKFSSPEEMDYVLVRQAIEDMVEAGLARSQCTAELAQSQASLNASKFRSPRVENDDEYHIPVHLPFHRKPCFKGRDEPLQQLWDLFFAKDSTEQRRNRPVVALCGPSGTGKSTIALEYAYKYAKEYSAIFWINTRSEPEMDASARKAVRSIIHHGSREPSTETYQRIAWSLDLEGRSIAWGDNLLKTGDSLMKIADESSCARYLGNWLGQERNNKWLLVLDNYDDPAGCDLKELLPNQDVGHVLITSCTPNPYPGCNMIDIPTGIKQEDAVDLLIQTRGRALAPDEKQGAVDVVEAVGRLPMAIVIIGASLSKSQIPLDIYAEDLKENLKKELQQLEIVWNMSRQKLTRNAKHLFWLFSFMDNEDIPQELLLGGMRIVKWMISKRVIYAALGELTSLALVVRKQDNSFWVHPLLHEWARDHEENAKIENSKLVVDIIRSTFAFGDKRSAEKCAYERRILPHIDKCFNHFKAQLPLDDHHLDYWNQKAAAYDLARAYTGLGNVEKSSIIYKQTLMGREDSTDPLDLEMMNSFGVNLRLQCAYDDALAWCQQAQRGIESQGGEESFKARVAHNIASIYKEKGSHTEAIEKYNEALKLQGHLSTSETQHQPTSSTLETQHQLACVLKDSGEYQKSLRQLEHVHEYRKKKLGEDHPNTLDTLHAIATVLEKQGKYEDALTRYDSVLKEQKKSLGDGHYSTLDTIDSVASIQERLGQYDDALKSYREALKGLERIFGKGKDHYWIASVHSGIADNLLRQAKYDEAEEAYKKAHASFERLDIGVRGEFPTATNIARVLREKGLYQEALNWCEIAREGLQKLGEDDEHMLALKVCIAHIFELQGMYSEALRMSLQLCEAFAKKHGENHTETLKTRCRLGSVLNCQGRYEEALEQFKQAQSGLTVTIGADHHQTLVAVQGQVDVLQQLGRYDQALQSCDHIQKTLGRILGEEHPQTLMAVYRSGSVLVSRGENESGLKVIQRAMDGWKAVLGETHPYMFMCLEDIGNAYKDQGESDQAIECYEKAIEGYLLKLGDDHPWVYRAQASLAGVLGARDPPQHDKAERLYSVAIIGLEGKLGSAHPWTIAATDNNKRSLLQHRNRTTKIKRSLLQQRATRTKRSLLQQWTAKTKRSLLQQQMAKVKRSLLQQQTARIKRSPFQQQTIRIKALPVAPADDKNKIFPIAITDSNNRSSLQHRNQTTRIKRSLLQQRAMRTRRFLLQQRTAKVKRSLLRQQCRACSLRCDYWTRKRAPLDYRINGKR